MRESVALLCRCSGNRSEETTPVSLNSFKNRPVIDGMRVASLPDLLATKLDVIMYRPKLRDYIDIAAIDKSGWYGIEDGLRFHRDPLWGAIA